MRALLLLLLSFVPCFAQLNVQQPIFQLSSTAQSIYNPSNLVDMVAWWAMDDLTNGAVSSWKDRVGGYNAAMASAPDRPIRTSYGVVFTNHQLGIASPTIKAGSFMAIWIVMRGSNVSAGQQLVVHDSAGYGLAWNTSARQLKMITDGSQPATVLPAYETVFDALMICSNNTGGSLVFTNGIKDTSWAGGGAGTQWNLNRMGELDSGFWKFQGAILEIMDITNGYNHGSELATNLHWYGTNKYGYSP